MPLVPDVKMNGLVLFVAPPQPLMYTSPQSLTRNAVGLMSMLPKLSGSPTRVCQTKSSSAGVKHATNCPAVGLSSYVPAVMGLPPMLWP